MEQVPDDRLTAKSSNELAEERTELAVFRTTMAASRSLMAWVRTGLSMIGFGFTIYKFLESLSDQIRPATARTAGLYLVGLGTISILFGCLEYWQHGRAMRTEHRKRMEKYPLISAAMIAALGILLLFGILLRIT